MDDERRRPGPRRPAGAPVGPEAVRRALLDAAAALFGRHGVDGVSLRDVAREAGVQVALIARYVGKRDDLIRAVFDDLSEQLGSEVIDRPLQQISFEAESVMGRWTRVLSHLVSSGRAPTDEPAFNPVLGLMRVIQDAYGLDEPAARLRGAQIVASALGWRIFEDYLIAAGSLEAMPRSVLHDELTATHRRLGATPWPSPPDPPARPPNPADPA